MIVVSVLLILVAVALLILGLADGSSTLLISSIVASLLAAVALVVGARRAATMRRAATADPTVPADRAATRSAARPIDVDYDAGAPAGDPVSAAATSRSASAGHATYGSAGSASAAPGPAGSGSAAPGSGGSGSAAPGSGGSGSAAPGPAGSDSAASGSAGPGSVAPGSAGSESVAPGSAASGSASRWREPDPEPSFADNPLAADEGLASPTDAKPRVANRDDAEAALAADAAYREGGSAYPDAAYPDAAYTDAAYPDAAYPDPAYPDPAYLGPANPDPDRPGAADSERAYPGGADTDRAYRDLDSALDDGAPSRSGPATTGGRDVPGQDYDRASSFIGGARSENPGENAWRRGHADDLDQGGRPGSDAAGLGPNVLRDPDPAFAEPDADDPDDEPLPQAVRPADAVKVARMTAEVLVVDGRPRYHLADCPHLGGRQTEALPASEAVELGFSPCGQCRPVDRLVAQAARR